MNSNARMIAALRNGPSIYPVADLIGGAKLVVKNAALWLPLGGLLFAVGILECWLLGGFQELLIERSMANFTGGFQSLEFDPHPLLDWAGRIACFAINCFLPVGLIKIGLATLDRKPARFADMFKWHPEARDVMIMAAVLQVLATVFGFLLAAAVGSTFLDAKLGIGALVALLIAWKVVAARLHLRGLPLFIPTLVDKQLGPMAALIESESLLVGQRLRLMLLSLVLFVANVATLYMLRRGFIYNSPLGLVGACLAVVLFPGQLLAILTIYRRLAPRPTRRVARPPGKSPTAPLRLSDEEASA